MIKSTFLIVMAFISLQSIAQTNNSKYNKTLANKLGGDDYGMKNYIFVILKTGPMKLENTKVVDSLFKGHLANINRLASIGKLVVAGPLKKNDKSYRGIFILDVKTKEAAYELLLTDPAIKEKLLDAELFEWYGSAALPTYLKVHEKIERIKM